MNDRDDRRTAHIRRADGAEQSLEEHCRNVSRLCERAAAPLGLAKTARLLGLLHDMGKATEAFRAYLLESARRAQMSSPHPHAPTGGIFVYRRWSCRPGAKKMERRCAQMLALCIYGHHAGLMDCLDTDGTSDFIRAMEQEVRPLHYEEAVDWSLAHVAPLEELDTLFEAMSGEVLAFLRRDPPISNEVMDMRIGMLTRLLLSILVDADRWDAACFDYGEDPLAPEQTPDWDALLAAFEDFRRRELDTSDVIGQIRGAVSDQCFRRAADGPGVYTLSVPTGGGKTFSSLRYALRHAALAGPERIRRIFYIIPYNTILDQNAQDIRDALGDHPSILEHHCDVVRDSPEEQEAYRRLTERWDSHIVLTSLVRFLDACFAASNTDARRLCRLTGAVLIFDEIQPLPKHCKTLFEQAVSFLAACCGSTVILCTATQPRLDLTPPPRELMEAPRTLFRLMERVRYHPDIAPSLSSGEAAARLARMLESGSVLTIVNTKAAAWDVYAETVRLLKEQGRRPIDAEVGQDCSDETICQRAGERRSEDILCVYLSTLLCPAHRKRLIRWMKCWLKAGAPVFCVSTALIEAGINVSFPTVVRSLTGLPSIAQAAGRANRNMEYERGDVYIWSFHEEKTASLPDIQNGGIITRSMLAGWNGAALDDPDQIDDYFRREQNYTSKKKDYPLGDGTTLYERLSANMACAERAKSFLSTRPLALYQSFRTAYQAFQPIPQVTCPVLVPFGEGAELIDALNSRHDMEEERYLLRRAQAYSVGLYEAVYHRLVGPKAVWPIGETGVYALEEGYYDEKSGVNATCNKIAPLMVL